MIQEPYWIEDHPRPVGLGSAELPSETDYLIVGSGLTGLTAGLRLARAGEQVTIVDSGEIAGGASSLNGGMVSPDVKAGMHAVDSQHGEALANEIWAATVRSVDLVRELCQEHSIDARINVDGMAALGLDDRDITKFEKTLSWYHTRFGVEWELIKRSRLGSIVGSDAFTGALFQPDSFGIHPARYSFGLAAAATEAGAQLVAKNEVLSVDGTGTGFEVETESGRIRAGHVILATNGYTSKRPVAALTNRIVSVGSYIIVTEPLSAETAAQVFPRNAMTYTKRRLLHYMRRTPDDRILIGGRRNLKPGLPLEASADDLRSSLIEYFPALSDIEITHVWGGKLGVPFDLIPHIGRVEGCWYAMGYGGHGVGLSTLLGHDLAGMLLGEDPTSPFARIAHQGRFYYRGNPWFLAPASVLYRTLDKVGL